EREYGRPRSATLKQSSRGSLYRFRSIADATQKQPSRGSVERIKDFADAGKDLLARLPKLPQQILVVSARGKTCSPAAFKIVKCTGAGDRRIVRDAGV